MLEQPVQVSFHEVSESEIPLVEEVVGTVVSQLRSVIEAKISGNIRKLPVAPGSVVKQGELLLEVDAREVKARFDQASAMLAQSEGDLRRISSVAGTKAVSPQEVDAARARVAVHRGMVEESKTLLEYGTIRAPFDGVVTRKLVEIGDLAAPGKPLLEVEKPGVFRVETNVPESLIEKIALSQRVQTQAGEGQEVSGVISEIAPAADASSRTFLVKIDLDLAQGVRAGQFVRVRLPIGTKRSVVIPAPSLFVRDGLELVVVEKEGRGSLRLVRTGKRLGESVEILSGLKAGERIVTSSPGTLKPNSALVES